MSATELTLRIIFSVAIVLAGLGFGLWLRRLLVRRLAATVLDNWLVQVLGVIAVLPPLLVAAGASSGIVTNGVNLLMAFLQYLGNTIDIGILVKNILLSLLIVVLAIGVARTFTKLTMRGAAERRLDFNLRVLLNRLSSITIMLIAIFWVLAIWNVAIEIPVAVLGTLTIAVAFSIQDILKDLVAGMYILVEHPFLIGDQISTATYTGRVVTVELRATRLRLTSGEDVTIPNAQIFGGAVVNNSRYPERRATVEITLPLEDFARAESPGQIITSVKEQEQVLEKPEPTVTVSGITGERVTLTLRFWIANGQLATVTDVVYALRTLFPSADLAVKETAGDV